MFNRNITEIKAVLKNVVKRDRVKTLLKGLSMAGKTGTKVDYGKDGGSILCFVFVGYFRQITLSFLV
jgi:cell division protein FtsI/penicillin-binding protein 2